MDLYAFLMDKATRYLAQREHSRAELAEKLTRAAIKWPSIERDSLTPTIDAVLDRLVELNLQSDTRFAEAFVQSRIRSGRSGVRRIALELKAKGIAPDIASQSLTLYASKTKEWAAIERLLNKRRDRSDQQNLRYLLNKGFSPDLAYKALRSHPHDDTTS